MTSHSLEPEHIIKTIQVLENRINERFPGAGLTQVCEDLLEIAQQAKKRSIAIGRPMFGVRVLSGFVILGILASVAYGARLIRIPNRPIPASEFIQVIDAGFSALVLISALLVFLFTLEIRVKRARAMKAIHELRSLVHIIDMHQLTKDPERVLWRDSAQDTKSSPKRTMDRFQLYRYLDYCSEMLALCGKIAALYAENFPDAQAVAAVNDLENLTSGQGRKIWQKIMILHAAPQQEEKNSSGHLLVEEGSKSTVESPPATEA